VAAPLLAILLLSACGSTPQGQDGADPDGPQGPAGVLTFGQTAGITKLDPNTVGLLTERQLDRLLWNGLTKDTPGGTPEPDLATDWTTSEDGLQWTFNLRDDVTYHDGRQFTAEDAVKNIEYVLDPEVASQARVKIENITEATAADDTTLVLDLSAPIPQLPAALTDVKMSDIDNIDSVNEDPNGTGPYMLESFVPGQSLDLVPYEDYFDGAPPLAGVNIVTYPDITAAQSALTSGDLTLMFNVPTDALEGMTSAGLEVLAPEDPSGAAVFELDTTSAPFDDVRARQALSYATDRESMLAAAYGGYGVSNPGNVIVSPTNPFYNDELTPHEFDLDRASELFAEAGVTEGSTLTYWALAGAYPELVIMGQIVQADLAEIGITLEIETNESSTWAEKFYPNGKSYPGLVVANALSFPPAPVPYSVSWFSDHGTCECNWAGTPEYNEAVEIVETSTDEAAVADAYDTIQQILNEESPIVVVANTSPISVVQGDVDGVWVASDGVVHVEDASLTG
jgi:peptide/nickel transport system substrate-binding protein